ncbi:MAG TPA: group 1 truncated hemoglobin [Leucothrix mucor]|uniref:Group 1 truncated hemoglobin n=1 Tax=Leucothrix mucor TaxID=45248 RepID=A0A7V2T0X6_LEUMU|nr:group 1 truncated hemoglobin [Leucothrix mucor]
MRTIFKKIGGKEAVEATVDRFYEYMLDDDRVSHFFINVNMEKQRLHQAEFIAFALGADNGYAGKDMRSAHQHLVDNKGLNDEHFDATVENLVKAMRDMKVPEEIIAEAGDVVESTRADVLCQ